MAPKTEKIDPFTVTIQKDDLERFKSLGFFEQMDAAVITPKCNDHLVRIHARFHS